MSENSQNNNSQIKYRSHRPSFMNSKPHISLKNSKISAKDNCDVFCLQQCSDKYEQLILRRQDDWSQPIQKISLKKYYDDSKFTPINKNCKKNIRQDLSSIERKDRINPMLDSSKENQNTNNSSTIIQSQNQNLQKKRKEIQKELIILNKKTLRLNEKCSSKLHRLRQINEELNMKSRIQVSYLSEK